MTCLYPGTFDPITNGHLDLIHRALGMFDFVYLAIAKNEEKNPLFNYKDRKIMAELALGKLTNTKVVVYDNLSVDIARELGVKTILRGLRATSDFEYELQMGYANNLLYPKLETLYLMPNLKQSFISSSIVRSIYKHDGEYQKLVPPKVAKYMKELFLKQNKAHDRAKKSL